MHIVAYTHIHYLTLRQSISTKRIGFMGIFYVNFY